MASYHYGVTVVDDLRRRWRGTRRWPEGTYLARWGGERNRGHIVRSGGCAERWRRFEWRQIVSKDADHRCNAWKWRKLDLRNGNGRSRLNRGKLNHVRCRGTTEFSWDRPGSR